MCDNFCTMLYTCAAEFDFMALEVSEHKCKLMRLLKIKDKEALYNVAYLKQTT